MIIINKQINGVAFKLPNGKLVDLKGNNVMNKVSEEDWDYICEHWAEHIKKITFSDKNPMGFLVYNQKEKEVEAQAKELAYAEDEDGSRQMTVEEADTMCYENLSFKELKGIAMQKNIAFSSNVKKKDLIKLIVGA